VRVNYGCVGEKVSGGLEDMVAVQGLINGERGMGDRYSQKVQFCIETL
jgi:hypothetical protein